MQTHHAALSKTLEDVVMYSAILARQNRSVRDLKRCVVGARADRCTGSKSSEIAARRRQSTVCALRLRCWGCDTDHGASWLIHGREICRDWMLKMKE